ncbi:MAG: acyl-[acyl-carrier-protein] thioesterase [Butyrivibrio sp.]|nr:acyl-[acyl-carrier-protein] thioesterase [Butyrivibrio sp.]
MYSFKSKIRYSEIDNTGALTPLALMNYFQDCSTFQTQEGIVNMEVMHERNLAWVVSSWQIVINRLPRLGENVVIGTLPYELKGFIGMRNFFMDTEDGERLAMANSIWSLIDIEKGVPCRITEDILETYPLDEKLDMNYSPRKLPFPKKSGEEGELFVQGEKLEIIKNHLDTNHHVNNAQYISIALDVVNDLMNKKAIPMSETKAVHNEKPIAFGDISDEVLDFALLKQIRAEYKKQSHLGDIIVPVVNYRKSDDNIYTVSLQDETGDIYCNVELLIR